MGFDRINEIAVSKRIATNPAQKTVTVDISFWARAARLFLELSVISYWSKALSEWQINKLDVSLGLSLWLSLWLSEGRMRIVVSEKILYTLLFTFHKIFNGFA